MNQNTTQNAAGKPDINWQKIEDAIYEITFRSQDFPTTDGGCAQAEVIQDGDEGDTWAGWIWIYNGAEFTIGSRCKTGLKTKGAATAWANRNMREMGFIK